MKITKIILLTIIFSLFTLQASAITFPNQTTGSTTGAINSGNGYFDDDGGQFGYTGTRNIFTLAESKQIWIIEPISANVVSGQFAPINSSFGTITDAVVHNGYLYFIDGGTLKKKKTRSNTGQCESSDTTAGGCISIIATGVGKSLRVYDNVLYYTSGTTSLRHLDADDNAVADFVISAPPNALTQHEAFTIVKNNSIVQAYVFTQQVGGFAPDGVDICTSTGCYDLYTPGNVQNPAANRAETMYSLQNYIYVLFRYGVTAGETIERLYYISNGSYVSIDYSTTDSLVQYRRAYVGGESTIGMIVQSATSYETYNSNEVGVGSLPTSEGSGIVQYAEKSIDVPNPTYYNDSTIPINVNLKFIISDENHTNYLTSATWHLLAFDPTGVMVEDHDLPIVCTQTQPWWDPFGVLSLFLVDLVTPWACDGTQTVQYSPNPGQFWMNGTWTIKLTEQIPGTTSILSTDTYNIINQSSTGTGVLNPPAPCPTCGLGGGGTINTNTSLQIIQVFSFVAFWGFIIWLGIVGTIIGIMAKSPSGVNGMAVIVVAWLSAVFIALIGLFDPFKIYIIVLSTLIAAVLFRFGKNATTTEEG